MSLLNEQENCVSVIIPIYNTETYLYHCLESVRKQSYQNLEVWMIDDGSRDQSASIAKKFVQMDSRFHLIQQDNKGLSAARNVGLDHATGDWIAFLDSDDRYTKHTIEILLNAALSAHTKMSMGSFYKCYSNLHKKTTIHIDPVHLTDRTALQMYFIMSRKKIDNVWLKLYQKEIFEKLRFPVGVLYEDTYILSHILDIAGNCKIVDEPIYYYYKRKDSITGDSKNMDSFLIAILHRWQHIKKYHPQIEPYVKDFVLENTCMILGLSYLSKNKSLWKRAVKSFRKAIPNAALHSFYIKMSIILFRISPLLLSQMWCVYTKCKKLMQSARL